MKVTVPSGKYIMAVSGGVDSMALLHCLAGEAGLELVVAHFEHGIRTDSNQDLQLVRRVAARYGLLFVYARGHLGPAASEETARHARYAFLRRVQQEQGAQAIITAHHQDDVIETALINMLRGTGPRGLSGIRSTHALVRPLLHVSKREVRAYARSHQLEWREDSTNTNERFLRNYLRRNVVPRLGSAGRFQMLERIRRAAELQSAIARELVPYTSTERLARDWFIALPYDVSTEAMATWLRRQGIAFDHKTVHRLAVFAKTGLPGKRADVSAGHQVQASKNHITLLRRTPKG